MRVEVLQGKKLTTFEAEFEKEYSKMDRGYVALKPEGSGEDERNESLGGDGQNSLLSKLQEAVDNGASSKARLLKAPGIKSREAYALAEIASEIQAPITIYFSNHDINEAAIEAIKKIESNQCVRIVIGEREREKPLPLQPIEEVASTPPSSPSKEEVNDKENSNHIATPRPNGMQLRSTSKGVGHAGKHASSVTSNAVQEILNGSKGSKTRAK